MRAVVRRLRLPFLFAATLGAFSAAWAQQAAPESTDQVLVFLRHGEKPEAGLGQLDCQGQNRALALPAVLEGKFGRPVAIFAPNPGLLKNDKGVPYNYVRPLATIEPTAIRAGLPVSTNLAFSDIAALESALLAAPLRAGTTLVAWEHHLAREAVKNLLAHLGGDTTALPRHWPDEDFDSLYVVRLHWAGDRATEVRFEHLAEGLNDLPSTCRN